MAVYQHLQHLKMSEPLPDAAKVGTCITCTFWNEEAPRPVEETKLVGRCVQPELKDYALVVSGASGCNHWLKQDGVGPEAEAYMQGGVAQA